MSELSQFDGKDGRPTYILFKGKVYDISSSKLWIEGTHMNMHTLKENLPETIKAAPHGEEVLSRFPIIGNLAPETTPETPVPAKPIEERTPFEHPMERREFLKLTAAAGGAVTLAALASSLKTLAFAPGFSGTLAWPKLKITNISSLQTLTAIVFNYPLTNTPNYLVKLGAKAQGGVGPAGDIVAFSEICQHLGCFYDFVPPNTSPPCNSSLKASTSEGYCCCHGSQYDFTNGARVIGGPAPRPVPQVQLQYDSTTGDIYAIAMGPPTIFGHGPGGTTDPQLVLQYDLSGGTIVGT